MAHMDWASNDYTQVYADTLLTPAPESDAGIYLLDEAAGGEGSPRRDTYYSGCEGSPRLETYYTGRGFNQGNEERRAIFGAAWDERPPRRQFHSLSPYAGSEWERLMPPERQAPYRFITQSEGLNNPSAINLPGAFSKECFGSSSGSGSNGSSGGWSHHSAAK